METRLKPIENPSSWGMKLVYYLSKRMFGKVLSPVKVISARLPLSFSFFTNKMTRLHYQLMLDKELSLMIKTLVSQINTCLFCIDIGKAVAIKMQKHSEKFYHLHDYETEAMFSASEKAALAFAEELTKDKKVSDETFHQAAKFFTERELIEIAWLVATEHYYNLMNIAFELHSDNLCDISMNNKNKKKEAMSA